MSFTLTQRHRAIGLYKSVLRAADATFQHDATTRAAWRQKVRHDFFNAAKETDATKIDEGLNMWDDVVKVLRQNIVQGEFKPEKNVFRECSRHPSVGSLTRT